MTTKPKTNGFGSFQLHLVFTVNNKHSQKLIDDGWEIQEETASGTVFKYNFTSRKRGDDETAMFELGHSLTEKIPIEGWRIDWDRSVY